MIWCSARARRLHQLFAWIISLVCFLLHSTRAFSSNQTPPSIPITVLSGFLGSGKTTLLTNLLKNEEGLRIALVVNDVASVNVDSKFVSSQNLAAGMIELQNGCACCSRAEELLASVAELVTLSDLRADDEAFDHILIECSGVADPKAVRAQFQQASLYQMPLMERVHLDTMATVIDAASYLEYLESDKVASPDETPELYYPDGKAPGPSEEDEDSFPDDIPPALRALLQPNNGQPLSAEESVAALLISQTETADVILLNKVDLATPERLQRIESIVRACCPAQIHRTTYANVVWRDVLAVAHGHGVAMAGVVDDHREAVKSATNSDRHETGRNSDGHDHASTSHEHSHSIHAHEHSHEGHSHDNSHGGHSHSHEHHHGCQDPDCNDPSHQHGASTTTHAGIATMVYQARRPFHPCRLTAFLRQLPIRMGLPPPAADDDDCPPTTAAPALAQIVRSKGFCWCSDSHRVAYYWSQAGPSFELSKVGAWWATLPRENWPASAVSSILSDFDDEDQERPVGDRRQEIVLIGTSLQSTESQAMIRQSLDDCLLQDDEWEEYWSHRDDEEALRARFPTPLSSSLMSY